MQHSTPELTPHVPTLTEHVHAHTIAHTSLPLPVVEPPVVVPHAPIPVEAIGVIDTALVESTHAVHYVVHPITSCLP